jgi:hypothetical protein
LCGTTGMIVCVHNVCIHNIRKFIQLNTYPQIGYDRKNIKSPLQESQPIKLHVV